MNEHPEDLIDMAYDALEGCEDLLSYHNRHGTPSMLILTQLCPKIAIESARLLAESHDFSGKVVVEIGAGVGFLAIELAKNAKHVYAIEVDAAWSWVFTRSLYKHKPTNLTWIFGDAKSMIGLIKADVAIVFTRSGQHQMKAIAQQLAQTVIMPLHESGDFNKGDFSP